MNSIILSILVLSMPCIMFPISIMGLHVNNDKKKQAMICCVILSIMFGLFGYMYNSPVGNPDIVRYISLAKEYSSLKFVECFNHSYNNLFLVDIWFWIVSKTGNYQLIPTTTCIIVYFIQVYIVTDYKLRKNINNTDFVWVIISLLSIMDFNTIVNGNRNYIAFSLFMLAIYREFVQDKKNIFTLILYICPCFIHPSSYLLLFVRVSMAIGKKIPSYILYILAIVPVFASELLALLISKVDNMYFLSLLKRAKLYFEWDEGGYVDQLKMSFSARLERYFFIFIISLIIIFFIKKKLKSNLDLFMQLYLIITVTTFFLSTAIYLRFSISIICLGMLYTMNFVDGLKNNNKIVVKIILFFASLVGLIINFHWIDVFLDWEKYVTDIISFPWSLID